MTAKQLTLSSTEPARVALRCALTPRGRIVVEPVSAAGGMSPSQARRIVESFEAGRGLGVLSLAVRELKTDLDAPLAHWRDLGRLFLARACAALDPLAPDDLVLPDADEADLSAHVEAAPPMQGAELLSVSLLNEIWHDLGEALQAVSAGHADGLRGYLKEHDSAWNVVGRVCLHLAENKRDPDYPFAFIATYVDALSKQAKPKHLPLGRALEAYAGARQRKKLLALLAPVSRAAKDSEVIRDLVDSGDVYHPLRWTPAEAHRFLCQVELYERAGLVVRLPDWWSAKRRPRPKVSVTVGTGAPSSLGLSALLDFDLGLTLGGEMLTEEEVQTLLEASDGLVWIKGRWVEVDHEKLDDVLARWRSVQRQAAEEGVSFAKAMRMLAGSADIEGELGEDDAVVEWSDVVAGDWLASRLEALRSPALRAEVDANAGLEAELRPYQKLGVEWLATLRGLALGGCLADDMGLGKTIQVLGALSLARDERGTDLLVVPASLLDNWRQEFARFAPELSLLVAHASHTPTAKLAKLSKREIARHDAVITSYGTATRLKWVQSYAWRNLILDEAQAIKNPGAKQTRAIKKLDSQWRLALTGTPIENRLGDLWSIFDFLNPGLLGSAKSFTRACKAMTKEHGPGYAPLRRLVSPYIMRRLKTDKRVIADLPDKTELSAYCLLSKRQAALYEQSVRDAQQALRDLRGIERRGLILALLMRLKQICNHPSQWLGDGRYEPSESGKFRRLRELGESIAARQDKLLVFTQFREMTAPLADFLAGVFGRSGLVLHGGTPIKKRQGLVQRFQEDETVPFMLLSLKAGGTGLNLTAASHVIHFDRWWNPAVENQATDRAFRIGQTKNVLVHKFVCRGTVEERIDELIAGKQQLSAQVLSTEPTSALTELSDDELVAMVSLDMDRAMQA